jgi:pimeloyl-ACP methyl ester carboxylesterase
LVRVRLYTRVAGDGAPVVLLHAFPLSSAMWLGQREGLSGVCRVITPDLRGFGGSPLAETLDAEGVDRVVIGGQSMGGYVAMAFCRRHPRRVRGLILADTKASADSEAARENRERIAREVERDGTGVLLRDVLTGLVGPTTRERRPMVYGRVRGLVQAAPPGAVAWASRAMAGRPDSFDTLRALRAPALVIVGEEDRLSPLADAEAMAMTVSDSRLVRIDRAGHLSAIEQPEAFNRAVAAFVRSLG